MKLSKNKVLITGATAGIGLELTRRFLALGNVVLAVGRNAVVLDALEREFEGRLIGLVCDLGDQVACRDLCGQIVRDHPDLNVLVNNAGIQHNYLFGDDGVSDGMMRLETEVNLVAVFGLCHALIPLLKAQPESAIVNVSSALAFAPKRSGAVYCATKAGVHAFSQALRYQLEDGPIRVFEVIPPLVDTQMTAGRGKGKISAAKLVDEFLRAFRKNRLEVNIGKVKLLRIILRLWPGLGLRMLKRG